jgi:hypothetical protein
LDYSDVVDEGGGIQGHHAPNTAFGSADLSTRLFANSFVFIRTQSADNPLGQDLIDLAMPRHWFRATRGWVMINVMLAPVSEQRASHLL